ncbi:MAG: helicase-related protein [Cyanobacteria bacterium P01_F01_bin.150]
MLETVIQSLQRQQRPYYVLQGKPIKGINNQYWLVFRHRDFGKSGGILGGIASLLGIKGKKQPSSHRLLRIDLDAARIYTYVPRQDGDIPSTTLLRTAISNVVERFLLQESSRKESGLLEGSLREVKDVKRRYNLPDQIEPYNKVIGQFLERSILYRRSTAYFDSGVLKLYQEPLQSIIQSDGRIRLLMDWQGFTKRRDIAELERLQDPEYRSQFTQRTLQEFLEALDEGAFNSTQMLAELVRLYFLQIRLVKMQQGRAIYHKKTGIFSDGVDNHVQHEGSDNFTRAAHSRNAESVTFLFSWERLDSEAVTQSIQEFDEEWQREDLSFDLSQEFLRQVLVERDRRDKLKQPKIETVTPDEFPPGETTEVTVTGENLDQVDQIDVDGDGMVDVVITDKEPTQITADVTVSPDHPPRPVEEFVVKTPSGTYTVPPVTPPRVPPVQVIPNYPEIEGFKEAIEVIQSGLHGDPHDFLYWCAQQRPRQFRVQQSDLLDDLVNDGILFEHQKSGAQHCLRVMQDFGVAVCADAVGLGKTRLAAAVARLSRQENDQSKIAIIAAKKLWPNWEREMAELSFKSSEYELYNKNLMSRRGSGFLENFNRYGGPDLVIIDEAHEGIRNYRSRIHRMCLQLREHDEREGRLRHFLLLTATPWNNRREDIYNLLSPFITRPEGFSELEFPPEVVRWFQSRDTGVESFTDSDQWFRRTYRELFLQRTRQMLREAMPNLTVYAKRQAEWLPVEFEDSTEQALEQIFSQFETQLYIPFADPVRYLRGDAEQRSLLQNQRRFFLQRAESSMYALKRTISNFRGRIQAMKQRLSKIDPTADGLERFLLIHYGFPIEDDESQQELFDFNDRESWDEDFLEGDEEDDDETDADQEERRQQLRRSIELAVDSLRDNPTEARRVYDHMWSACDSDLMQLDDIQELLAEEFVQDHKRETVTNQVRSLVEQGHKVLLISTFSDTVIDYYRHMGQDPAISQYGIGMAIGSTKAYFPADDSSPVRTPPHNFVKDTQQRTGIKRQDIFRLFAPVATCRNPGDRPNENEELSVLIGSETLSVGQNLQDADYLINIDLPWNPMTLEQRIGRIDRPKQRPTEYIHIYYANSQSQLLRQASRLANLNRKLVGSDLAQRDEGIEAINSIDTLGASIYGDTLFDDTILPGYVEFLHSLSRVRQMEQESFQERVYQQQETRNDLYSQQELLFTEEISQSLQTLGKDYLPNPIALGSRGKDDTDPISLVVLEAQYFGPNNEAIPDRDEQIFWNDQTQEQDGFGMALATAFKTARASSVLPTSKLIAHADALYDQLVQLKQMRSGQLEQEETLENVTVTSARLNRIQKRISTLTTLPEGVEAKFIRSLLKRLNSGKEIKQVQRFLRKYTDGDQSKLDDAEFVVQFVADADALNLLESTDTKAVAISVRLSAILIRSA